METALESLLCAFNSKIPRHFQKHSFHRFSCPLQQNWQSRVIPERPAYLLWQAFGSQSRFWHMQNTMASSVASAVKMQPRKAAERLSTLDCRPVGWSIAGTDGKWWQEYAREELGELRLWRILAPTKSTFLLFLRYLLLKRDYIPHGLGTYSISPLAALRKLSQNQVEEEMTCSQCKGRIWPVVISSVVWMITFLIFIECLHRKVPGWVTIIERDKIKTS